MGRGDIDHIARHRVQPVEAEQVILNDPVDLGIEIVEGEERFVNLGATSQGRILLVVTTWREDRIRVVTAFAPINGSSTSTTRSGAGNRPMANKQSRFRTEAEEAKWWSENQELIAERFEKAKASGKLGKGTVARIAKERAGASPTITIRLPESDLARARNLAAKRGLRYQTYLKMLLHEALSSEEKSLSG